MLKWNENDPLPNYSLSYLFSQYLRTQAVEKGNNAGIHDNIMDTSTSDFTVVDNVIRSNIDAYLSLGAFMTNFRTAMLVKADNGKYGFSGESAFDVITPQIFTGTDANLDGGGAVVKNSSGVFE